MTFYSDKKRDKYYWLITILLIGFVWACGPTKEELEVAALRKDNSITGVVNVKTSTRNVTLEYYLVDSCDYVGSLSNSSSDHIAHTGTCRYCHKKDSLLIVSILQKFFQTSKK